MSNKQDLFSGFPEITYDEWIKKVKEDLKGADFDKKLVWRTLDGFAVMPFYRAEDISNNEFIDAKPGYFPYIRGTKNNNDWQVRQDIDVENTESANKKALEILNKGVTAIGFNIKQELSYEEFEILLKDIVLEAIPIYFNSGNNNGLYSEYLLKYAEKHNLDKSKISGADSFDSLGFLVLRGFTPCGEKACKCISEVFYKTYDKLPNFRPVSINAKYFQNAGASISQELGFSLSAAAEYLDTLTEDNYSIDQIAPKIQFNFASGSNYFMEIAKIRAARLLWAKITDAYKPQDKETLKMNIHVETATWNMTVYDPYVNMLRATTEAMSAALGGADSLNILPTNIAYEEPTNFTERIARNIQLILKEEAHFDKVIDPAGGSYYIETLTKKVASKAWDIFLKTENRGGFSEAFKQNYVQDKIENTLEKRKEKLNAGKEVLVGTNKFPNENEHMESGIDINRLFTTEQKDAGNGRPLRQIRISEEFESLRIKTDYSKEIPTVFLLTVGKPTMRTARAQFTANFFAVAGFNIINNIGFESVEEGYKAAKEAGSKIIVLCSSDEEYEKYAKQLAELDKNSTILVIAGNPESREEIKNETGIKDFIHIKTNILDTLKDFQNRLGI